MHHQQQQQCNKMVSDDENTEEEDEDEYNDDEHSNNETSGDEPVTKYMNNQVVKLAYEEREKLRPDYRLEHFYNTHGFDGLTYEELLDKIESYERRSKMYSLAITTTIAIFTVLTIVHTGIYITYVQKCSNKFSGGPTVIMLLGSICAMVIPGYGPIYRARKDIKIIKTIMKMQERAIRMKKREALPRNDQENDICTSNEDPHKSLATSMNEYEQCIVSALPCHDKNVATILEWGRTALKSKLDTDIIEELIQCGNDTAPKTFENHEHRVRHITDLMNHNVICGKEAMSYVPLLPVPSKVITITTHMIPLATFILLILDYLFIVTDVRGLKKSFDDVESIPLLCTSIFWYHITITIMITILATFASRSFFMSLTKPTKTQLYNAIKRGRKHQTMLDSL